MVVKNLFFIGGLILLLTSCVPKQEDLKNALQTNSATIVKNDYKTIQKLLIKFKEKLDKRNPTSYSKKYENRIYRLLNTLDSSFLLKYKTSTLENYKEYLQIAFSKDDINIRNDYLVMGIYYLMYEAYELDNNHKVTALSYDKEKIDKIHKNLQIIKWKIKTNKDLKGDYLFLTWQNNWQIELDKKLKAGEKLSYEDLQNLKFIKDNKESLLDPSNFSFEVLLTQMINSTENSLRALGEEPKELAVKAMFLFL